MTDGAARQPHILVVDDEEHITELVAMGLGYNGFDVERVASGRAALEAIERRRPDLVVLDVMLPDLDGFEVARRLRESRRGGHPGPDHLPHRPGHHGRQGPGAAPRQRRLRHQAVQHRGADRAGQGRAAPGGRRRAGRARLSYADLELDEDTRDVWRAGRLIELTPTEYKLLHYLLANARRVLTRDQILEHVWDYTFAGNASVLETYISYLRHKIDDTPPAAHPHRPGRRLQPCACHRSSAPNSVFNNHRARADVECRHYGTARGIRRRASAWLERTSVNRTIPELFRTSVEEVPDKTWLLAGDRTYTYAEALDRIERAASWLRAMGVGPSQRVLVTARNSADYLLSWFALMEAGAIQVPVNPASAPSELAGLHRQVNPALVIADPDLSGAVPGPTVEVGELFRAEADGRGPASIDSTDVAVMIPTSGTTGRSKLVMQTHLAYVMAGEGFGPWLDLTGDDRLMTSLPLFHINAPAYTTLGSVAARASMVLLPRFSPSTFLDAARRYAATQFNAIGAMIEMLMRQPPHEDDADTPLRLGYTGPSPDRERHLDIERRFGIELSCGYALSESPYGLIWKRGTRPFETLGAPRQHPQLGHVNDARVTHDGAPVEPGQVGELELRNPAIMRGYYEMPEETAAVIVDGWLRTGDLVTGNGDGTYTFVGRKKQIIRRRGENLSPTEVEAALERHPDVVEAAVIGVPSELSEEEVKAFIIAAPGRTIVPVELQAFAAARLARYKVPRFIEIVDELPHTPTGRLAKHLLPTDRTAGETDLQPAR